MIHGLENLQHRLIESMRGYKTAFHLTADEDLRELLLSIGVQREYFSQELSKNIEVLGGSVKKASAYSPVKQAWMTLQDQVEGPGDESLVKECIRGEQHAIEDFQAVLQIDDLDPTVKMVLEKELTGVRAKLKALRRYRYEMEEIG